MRIVIHSLSYVTGVNSNKIRRSWPTYEAKALKNVLVPEKLELNLRAHDFKSFWLLIYMPSMDYVMQYYLFDYIYNSPL